MNFGIQGRRAVVCASSKGLDKACALALATEGVQVLINARSEADLDQTAEEIGRKTGAQVIAVAADITTVRGRDLVLEACPHPDILINNAGGPPSGDFRSWNRKDWLSAVDANMLTPISLIKIRY
jgi:3-oxoacyl-[acyl-carrier protein] reductase